jgi:hypothetical protein
MTTDRPRSTHGVDGRNYPCEWCGEFMADAPGHLCEECAASVRPSGARWDDYVDDGERDDDEDDD